MTIARVLVPLLIFAAALSACSSTGAGTDAKQDAGPAASSTQLKSVSFSGLTVQVPTDFKVTEKKSQDDEYVGSGEIASTYIEAPGLEGSGMTLLKMPAGNVQPMERLVAGESASDAALPGAVKEQPAVQLQVAGIPFERVNFTVQDSNQGFVMLGTDGADKVLMSCGPNSSGVYQSYEKIALSLKR